MAVINYPNDHEYTRVTEFKHLTGQAHAKTSVVYEYPCDGGDPYYPIPRAENAALYKQYEALAAAIAEIHFSGRLATYKYYNMDQVVAQALTLCSKLSATSRDYVHTAKSPARESGPATGDQTNKELISRMTARIEFHPAVIGHQAVHFLLHVVELGIADAGNLRDARDGLVESAHAGERGLRTSLHAGIAP